LSKIRKTSDAVSSPVTVGLAVLAYATARTKRLGEGEIPRQANHAITRSKRGEFEVFDLLAGQCGRREVDVKGHGSSFLTDLFVFLIYQSFFTFLYLTICWATRLQACDTPDSPMPKCKPISFIKDLLSTYAEDNLDSYCLLGDICQE
jgi:hypothetical protein